MHLIQTIPVVLPLDDWEQEFQMDVCINFKHGQFYAEYCALESLPYMPSEFQYIMHKTAEKFIAKNADSLMYQWNEELVFTEAESIIDDL